MAENGLSPDVAMALIMQRFDATDLRNDERADETNRRLAELTEQVKKTNGTVTRHDREIGVLESNIRNMQRVTTQSSSKLNGEDRRITQRDVIVFGAGIAATYGVFEAIQWALQAFKAGS